MPEAFEDVEFRLNKVARTRHVTSLSDEQVATDVWQELRCAVCRRACAEPILFELCRCFLCLTCTQVAVVKWRALKNETDVMPCPAVGCSGRTLMSQLLNFGSRRAPDGARMRWGLWLAARCVCIHHADVRLLADDRICKAVEHDIEVCDWRGPVHEYSDHVRQCQSERRLQCKLDFEARLAAGTALGPAAPDLAAAASLAGVPYRPELLAALVPQRGVAAGTARARQLAPQWAAGKQYLLGVVVPHRAYERPRGPFKFLEYRAGEEIAVLYEDIAGCSYGIRQTDGRCGWFPTCCVTPVAGIPHGFVGLAPPPNVPLAVAAPIGITPLPVQPAEDFDWAGLPPPPPPPPPGPPLPADGWR